MPPDDLRQNFFRFLEFPQLPLGTGQRKPQTEVIRKLLHRRLQQLQSALRVRSSMPLFEQKIRVRLSYFRVVWS